MTSSTISSTATVAFSLLILLLMSTTALLSSAQPTTSHEEQEKRANSPFPFSAKNKSSLVREITGPWYLHNLVGPHKAAYLLIYASWSAKSRKMAREWENFAGRVKGIVKVGAMDGSSPQNEQVAKQGFHVEGFPTIVHWRMGSKNIEENLKALKYTGKRTADALEKHALAGVRSETTHVYDHLLSKMEIANAAMVSANKKVLVLVTNEEDDKILPAMSVVSSFVHYRFQRIVKTTKHHHNHHHHHHHHHHHQAEESTVSPISFAVVRTTTPAGKELVYDELKLSPTAAGTTTKEKYFNKLFVYSAKESDVDGTLQLSPDSPIASFDKFISSPSSSKQTDTDIVATPNLVMKFLLPFLMPSVEVAAAASKSSDDDDDDENNLQAKGVALTPAHECTSLEECFSKHANVPFVVRQTPELAHTSKEFGFGLCEQSNVTVQALGISGDTEHVRVSDLMGAWRDDTLDFNVFDSPVALFRLPEVFDKYELNWQNNSRRMSPAFACAGQYTILHTDSPDRGGGYMHLWAGEKVWHFIHPKYLLDFMTLDDELNDVQPRDWQAFLASPAKKKIDNIVDAFLSNKKKKKDSKNNRGPVLEVITTTIRAGDTVMFPPGWLHRVWTLEKAFGIAGYITVRGAEQQLGVEQESLRQKIVEAAAKSAPTKK